MLVHELQVALGKGNAEQDRNFAEVFVETADYAAVARGSRCLILGGRGAGKSAIFRYLAHSARRSDVVGDATLTVALSADQTSWPAFEQAVRSSSSDPIMLSRQWELALLIVIFNELVDNSRDLKRKRLVRDVNNEVDKVLEKTQLSLHSEGMLTDIFKAAATILRELPFTFKVEAPFVPISIELKDENASAQPPGKDRERLQIFLIEGMYGVLRTLLAGGAHVRVLADQLDEGWGGRPEQKASLCALITAVMRINNILVQRELDTAINFSILLRSDIYEVLKRSGLDDATKYRRDELHLRWDRTSLTRMIDKRIEVARSPGVKQIDDLFEKTRLERRTLVDYFFSRVVPRPRDVIQFLGLCLEEAELRGDQTISAESLSIAEANYSAWRRDVILEEARYGSRVKSPESLIGAMSSGERSYTDRELNRRLDASKRDYGMTETKPVLINALFEWGVLGVDRARASAQFTWDVHDLRQPKPKPTEDGEEEETWVVHPSLWTALDLRAPRKTKAAASDRP